MKGSFLETKPIKLVETAKIPVEKSNLGIAAVIPAYNLYELLFGDELKQRREK